MTCSVMGANARLCMKEQTDLLTKATGNYTTMPFISADIVTRTNLNRTQVLGYGREMQRPARDVMPITGTIVVPLDTVYVGYWLKAALAAPTTTGSSNYTHLFKSGSMELPAFTIEIQAPDAPTPLYRTYVGCMVDTIAIEFSPEGQPQLRITIVGVTEERDNTSDAGTPTAAAWTWYHQKHGTLTKDAVALAKVLSFGLTLNNNLDAIRYVGGGGLTGCIAPGTFEAGGPLVATYNDLTNYNLALNETLFDLAAGYMISATQKITFELDQAELVLTGEAIGGPGRIEQNFDVVGSKDFSEGDLLRVTLLNQTATY